MAEFELDSDALRRAKTLTSLLMEDLRRTESHGAAEASEALFSARRFSDEPEILVRDVIDNVKQMAMEFSLAREFGTGIPCLKLSDGELAPIALLNPSFDKAFLPEWLYFSVPQRIVVKHLENVYKDEIAISDFNRLQESIERNLESFLSYRFAGSNLNLDIWTYPQATTIHNDPFTI